MSSMFETDVRDRRQHTPWARMNLAGFMKEMAMNGVKEDEIERVKLSVYYRKNVSSGFWWEINWISEDGEWRSASGQYLDLCLWRAAETEMRVRKRLEAQNAEKID